MKTTETLQVLNRLKALKAAIWQRDQGKCTHCGSTYALELDHLHPYAMGGKTQYENLRLLCRNCNQRKGQNMFLTGVQQATCSQ